MNTGSKNPLVPLSYEQKFEILKALRQRFQDEELWIRKDKNNSEAHPHLIVLRKESAKKLKHLHDQIEKSASIFLLSYPSFSE